MQTSRQYNSCKTVVKTTRTKHVINTKKYKYKYKTMENLQIQVKVIETIILFIKTTTKGSKSLMQVAKT